MCTRLCLDARYATYLTIETVTRQPMIGPLKRFQETTIRRVGNTRVVTADSSAAVDFVRPPKGNGWSTAVRGLAFS